MARRRSRAQPTLRDIAAHAHVSVATVSRVLSGGKPVGPAMTSAVLDAAERLGYPIPNRGVPAGHRLGHVAMIADAVESTTTSILAPELAALARRAGWTFSLSEAAPTPEGARRELAALMALQPQALVISGAVLEDAADGFTADLKSFEAGGVRIVALGAAPQRWSGVAFDEEGAGRLLGAHLVSADRVAPALGRLAVLAGPAAHPLLSQRLRGLRSALAGSGLTVERVLHGPPTRVAAFAATAELMESGGVDTIVALSDYLALGACAELQRRGLQIPADVAVVSIDGLSVTAHTTPPITTVALPYAEAARKLFELLEPTSTGRAISARRAGPHQQVLAGRLLVRESG